MDSFNYLFTLTDTQITTIENLIKGESQSTWLANTYRQDKLAVHKETEAILLKFWNKTETNPITVVNTTLISKYSILDEVFAKAAEVLGLNKYIVQRYLFAKLPAGKQIYKHKDSFEVFKYSHRIHVPIITSEDCLFTVDDQTMSIQKGKATEINNLTWHSVENKSNIDRIHLIFDIKPDLS